LWRENTQREKRRRPDEKQIRRNGFDCETLSTSVLSPVKSLPQDE